MTREQRFDELEKRVERLESVLLMEEEEAKETAKLNYLHRQHARRELWRQKEAG